MVCGRRGKSRGDDGRLPSSPFPPAVFAKRGCRTGCLSFLLNGGEEWFFDWIRERSKEDRAALVNALSALPLLLVVGRGADRFHVVHADLVRTFGEVGAEVGGARITFFTDVAIDAGLPWSESRFIVGLDAVGSLEEALVWDRSLVAAANLWLSGTPVEGLSQKIPGLSKTHGGHTPLKEPLLVGSHRLLDTGAFREWKRENGLSVSDPRSDKVYTARRRASGGVEIMSRAFLSLGE